MPLPDEPGANPDADDPAEPQPAQPTPPDDPFEPDNNPVPGEVRSESEAHRRELVHTADPFVDDEVPASRGERRGAALQGVGQRASSLSTHQLVSAFQYMTLVELTDFVRRFEEVFHITSGHTLGFSHSSQYERVEAREKEPAEETDVVLVATGEKRIQVMKEVRALTSLGLKEAKDLVDGAPRPVLEHVSRETAERARALLEAAGATVESRPSL